MSKISNQLQEVVKQKKQLATNLNVKGVSASQDETLNTLVPKVLSIVGGTGDVKLGTKEITEDGEYFAYEDGVDGYSSVNVNVTKGIDFLATFNVASGNSTSMNIKMLGDVPEYAFNNARVNELDLTLTKEVASNGLYNNGYITKIIAPNPLIAGSYAFSGCNQAEGEVTVSEEQTKLEDYTFNGCKLLKINVHDKITNIGKYVFNNCESIDWTSLPPLLTYIPVYNFYKCINLKITELPVGITSISQYALAYCSGIETLKIHDACKIIENSALRYCTGLKELEIGSGITSLNYSYCLANCTALEKFTIHATKPPNLSSTAFYRDDALKEIRVPVSALETYKSASNWSKYADIMIGIEGE